MQCVFRVIYATLIISISFYIVIGNAKICYGDHRLLNDWKALEVLKDCEIIVGHLQILLINGPNKTYIDQNFPKLKFIYNYLLMFNVDKLISVGDLFPNLQIIYGNTTCDGYTLVIYKAKDLKKIGLKNLKYIGKGNVRIGKCENLCYAKTVNWKKLNVPYPIFDESGLPQNCSEKCPKQCPDGCWSATECQGYSDKANCIRNNGSCVDKCPSNKYALIPSNICFSEEECKSLNRFIYKGTCLLKCPKLYRQIESIENGMKTITCEYCEKFCERNCSTIHTTKEVGSISYLEELEGCTYIEGNLTIRANNLTSDDLQKYLGDVRTITHFLKIYRSEFLEDLGFLNNLTDIRGDVLDLERYSVVMHDNQKLNKLWDYHLHPLNISAGIFRFHFNPQLCYDIIMNFAHSAKINLNDTDEISISPHSNGDQRMCTVTNKTINITDVQQTNLSITWDPYIKMNEQEVTSYIIYYMETVDESETNPYADACGFAGWEPIYTDNNYITLTNLKPYTNYTYYIKTTVDKRAKVNELKSHPQTKLHTFQTLSGDPSKPLDVQAISYTHDSIILSWKPPDELKGVLSHYLIYQYKEIDDPSIIYQRDYCKDPPTYKTRIIPPQESKPKMDCVSFCQRKKYFENLCYAYEYEDAESCKNPVNFEVEFTKHEFEKRGGTKNIIQYYNYIVEPNATQYEIKELHHFTTYIFLLSACNRNHSLEQQCSEVIMSYNRTLAKRGADSLSDLVVHTNANNATLQWNSPKNPNSLILTYHIEFKRKDDDNTFYPYCLHYNQRSYMGSFVTGTYKVRMRAVTLAGAGMFTKYHEFTIDNPKYTTTIILIVVFCILFLVVLAAVGFYVLYRKKRKDDKTPINPNVNPYYDPYIEDEWEIERKNIYIDFEDELGQGTFGKVYNGRIISKELPCAIKAINPTADEDSRVNFLKEASVMKHFNEAHHVIRLLGVCSRGRPTFVLMELMACGDLKTFLRKSRDSSQCITCNEMYLMAAQIADGMSYLAAKKFIHRDLAARNCMVAADHTIKIGDFGMARDIYESDYYRKENKGLLPVRWMAPESLADGVFTTDSDIWSYGVVLWEMVTLAEQPYQGLANEQVLAFVKTHGSLERPNGCPDLFFDIMKACWKWKPIHRPLFTNIIEKLSTYVGQNFQFVSFYHSREGEEYRMNQKERPFNPPAKLIAESEAFAYFSASDENVSLYSGDPPSQSNRFLSIPHQRQNRSYEDSPINGYSSYPLSP